MTSAGEMFHAKNRSRSAKIDETFGWPILVQGTEEANYE